MAIGSYKNLTRLLGQLADVNTQGATTGDVLTLDSNGVWVPGVGGTNSGLTHVTVDSNYFTGDGTATNGIGLKVTNISHTNLANLNTDTNNQHISATQLGKIHSPVSINQPTNANIDLTLSTNQALSASVIPSNVDHAALSNLNSSNYNHLTSDQVSALHPAVSVNNATNAAVTLTLGSNQVLSASFTGSNSDILTVPLTGFSASAGTIAATDTILQAFNKAQGSITNLENVNVRATRFVTISSGTSGTITIPTNNTIVLDDFGGTVDAVITASSGGKPTGTPALDTNGAIVTTSLDTNGAYVLSGTPASYPVALVYRTRCKWVNYDDTASDIAGDKEVESDHNSLVNVQGGTADQFYHLTSAQHTIATAAATSSNAGYVTTNAQTYSGDKTLSGVTTISNNTASSSTTNGALVIVGGVGIGEDIYAGGDGHFTGSLGSGGALSLTNTNATHTISSTNASTTATNGALVIAGGVGIGGALNITGAIAASNLSGTNTGNETVTSIGTLINEATNKDTPIDADYLGLMDSAASNVLKKLSWANIKAALYSYIRTGATSAPGAGYIGEEIIAYANNTTTTGADTEINVSAASITLTAGVWDLSYSCNVNITRPSGGTQSQVYSRIQVRNSANTVISGTSTLAATQTVATGTSISVFAVQSATKRITAAETYRLTLTCSAATSNGEVSVFNGAVTGSITGDDCVSYIRAVRIA